jgi:hypothetical protein
LKEVLLEEVLLKKVLAVDEGYVEECYVEGGPNEVLVESTKAAVAGTTTPDLPLGTWMCIIVQYIVRSHQNCLEACGRGGGRGGFFFKLQLEMSTMAAG